MASVGTKSEMPIFSYAEAAKGVSAPLQSLKHTSVDPNKESLVSNVQYIDSGLQAKPESAIHRACRDEEGSAGTGVEPESTPASKSKPNTSGTSSPSVGASSMSTAGRDDEVSATPNGTSDSTWDKQSQGSGPERQRTSTEGTKPKSSSTSENTALPLKELRAAPLPSVNIWQQRKEAQDAKAKTISSLKLDVTPVVQSRTPRASQSAGPTDNQQELSRPAFKGKVSDGVSDGIKDRKRADGRKSRGDDVTIPPVGDAASWPTPQVAQGEEMRRAQGKAEKSERGEKSSVIRPHGKEKWTPVPYVPTAVFSTPLPSTGRRGGRVVRGGRDGGRSTGDQASQSLVDKHSLSADIPKSDTNATRTNSLPAQSRRSNSTDAVKPDDSRKNYQPADRSRGAKGSEDATAGKENHHQSSRDGKSLPRNMDNSKNSRPNLDSHSGNRGGSFHDRRLENSTNSVNLSAGLNGDRDHRENHFREPRGRGPRGRPHGPYSASQIQFVNHMPAFHPKSFGFNDRQRPHTLTNGSHKMSVRSPSLPNSASMYGVYPFPSDTNATALYGYSAIQAPMSATPYQQYMEPFSLMSMISVQLEYYFSVDNLCKDLFLRKHMDSQGFVALSFIAGFKRIKTLTEDFELLRHVCHQLRNVEYQASDDGVDRLRAKHNWQQWVLPMAQRDPSGQHEGPSSSKSFDESVTQQDYMNGMAGELTLNGLPQSLPNGTSEYRAAVTSLSLTAPEFSPSKPLMAQSQITNVWLPESTYSSGQ